MSLFCFYDSLTSNPASWDIRVKPYITKVTSLVQPIYIFQISLSILFLREFTSLGASGGLFPSLVLGRSGKSYILYTLMNPL